MLQQGNSLTDPRKLPQRLVGDKNLDDNLPPLASSRDRPHRKSPVESVGLIDSLPLELIRDILLVHLDLRSLFIFRQVNRLALNLVDTLPEYGDVVTHALNALKGILAIGTASWITCGTLHQKLCTSSCEECGDFTRFLYLLTCKRVCYLCFTQVDLYLPLVKSRAMHKFGLSRRVVDSLPCMTVLPGKYSLNTWKSIRSTVLIDHEHARLAGISSHGSLQAMEDFVSQSWARELATYQTRLAERPPDAHDTASSRPRPPFRTPVDKRADESHRFVAIVRAPWLNKHAGRVEWGFYCAGCNYNRRPDHWAVLYSPVTFERHIDEYGDVQDGKHYLR